MGGSLLGREFTKPLGFPYPHYHRSRLLLADTALLACWCHRGRPLEPTPRYRPGRHLLGSVLQTGRPVQLGRGPGFSQAAEHLLEARAFSQSTKAATAASIRPDHLA